MWIKEAEPAQVAELFHNYQNAFGVCGKGSECGSLRESGEAEKSAISPAVDSNLESRKSHEFFAQPGEAEWGC